MDLSGVKSISPWLPSQLIPANQRTESGSGSGSSRNAKQRLLKGTEAETPPGLSHSSPILWGISYPGLGDWDLGHWRAEEHDPLSPGHQFQAFFCPLHPAPLPRGSCSEMLNGSLSLL